MNTAVHGYLASTKYLIIMDFKSAKTIRKLISIQLTLSRIQWCLVILFSILIYLSIGIRVQPNDAYRVSIAPDKTSAGIVKVVLYDPHYDNYLASGALRIPVSGWALSTEKDSKTLTALVNAAPLVIYTEGEPIEFSLLHFPVGGVVSMVAAGNAEKVISLKSSAEVVTTFEIGGGNSIFLPSSQTKKTYSTYTRVAIFSLVFMAISIIANTLLMQNSEKLHPQASLNWSAAIFFALPFFISSSAMLFVHRTVSSKIDLIAVLLNILIATSIALILKELYRKGVSRFTAQIFAIIVAILPQNSIYYASKPDNSLSTIISLFFAWTLLIFARQPKINQRKYLIFVLSFSFLIVFLQSVFLFDQAFGVLRNIEVFQFNKVFVRIKEIIGTTNSLLPKELVTNIQTYTGWSNLYTEVWFFWKLALIFYICLFFVLFRSTMQSKGELCIIISLSLLCIFAVVFSIPFKPYRFAYPATLLLSLFSALAFVVKTSPPKFEPPIAESKRIFWVDLCRVIAIFGVILIHSSGKVFYSYGKISTDQWLVANLVDSLVRAAVPLFVMISGVLLLNVKNDSSVNLLAIIKRIEKVLIPLIFWSVFYLGWINYNSDGEGLNLIDWLRKFLSQPVMYHLWFVYMIIGLYAMLPILQVIFNACVANSNFKFYFLTVWFIVNCLGVYVNLPLAAMQFTMILGYGGYFILGGLLNTTLWISVGVFRWVLFYLVGVVATFTITWVRTSATGVPDELAYSYFSPNVFLAAIGAFMLVRKIWIPSQKWIRLIQWSSDASFFIFFSHIFVLDLLISSSGGISSLSHTYLGLFIAISAIGTFVLCLVCSELVRLVPGSRRVVG